VELSTLEGHFAIEGSIPEVGFSRKYEIRKIRRLAIEGHSLEVCARFKKPLTQLAQRPSSVITVTQDPLVGGFGAGIWVSDLSRLRKP